MFIMNYHEPPNKSYWNDETKKIRNRVEELASFISDSQNSLTPEGEDNSDVIGDAEIELIQLRRDLTHALIESARIEQQEEISKLLPQIEERRIQIAQLLRQSDTDGAKDLREILDKMEARVSELQKDPVIDDSVE